MLSTIQIQAITRCLIDLDQHAERTHDGSGENLLAVLQETPVQGHPDPTARHLGVNPLPVPPRMWSHCDGPAAALRQAHDDLRRSEVPDQLTRVTDTRFLAWVYLYTATSRRRLRRRTVRRINAVDIDGRAYLLTHVPGDEGHNVLILPGTAARDADGTLAVLHTLTRTMRTGG